MTRQKLSVSERIRKQLDLGKSPKEISKYLKCSTGLVYAVRAAEKRKEEKAMHDHIACIEQQNHMNIMAAKPGAVRYGDFALVTKESYTPQPSAFKRFTNWLFGG